jgi:hypothetical protein
MKIIIVLMFLCIAGTVFAQEVGRYQMVAIEPTQQNNTDQIAILDTRFGDLWILISNPSINDKNIKGERSIVYMGKARQGKKMGEIIEHQSLE